MADVPYQPEKIESKWQKIWEAAKCYQTASHDTQTGRSKPKYYLLEMFPYPSGKLHMGHVRNYSIGDALARFRRMQGYNVLYPMGYDAFGLPAENAAIKGGTHPKDWTLGRMAEMKAQQQTLGFSYDWERMVATCLPEYYRWNQWIFLKFFEKGLAYQKEASVNWCPDCQTVLANEQVEQGKCWRCGQTVLPKSLKQWFFNITAYADELLRDLEKLSGWPERVRTMQANWIGKSYGTEIYFPVVDSDQTITTFTTRPDTVYGVTYVVLAPEHPLVMQLCAGTPYEARVRTFLTKVQGQSAVDRTAATHQCEGMFIGRYVTNPVNGEQCPLYIADYVLMGYGTGCVMAVPAHDQRDFEFAKRHDLPIKRVIQNPERAEETAQEMTEAYEAPGMMMGSGQFDGMESTKAKEAITSFLAERKQGKQTVQYRLRDWLVSRQRYWGTPIPIIHCPTCGVVPVPYANLPVLLPEEVTITGEGNPLAKSSTFLETVCPQCKQPAKRETDTMDTFVDSSWYFLRYTSPNETTLPVSKAATDHWMPVDQYIGGIEHAILHLLYARFFCKVLRDLGLVSFDEPFQRLLAQGMVTKDGAKMSKSLGNTVDPETIIQKYGADTARVFILFASPPERDLAWSQQGVEGAYRFLSRVWRLVQGSCSTAQQSTSANIKGKKASHVNQLAHRTLNAVTEDLDQFGFNTAIARIMELVNGMYKEGTTPEAIRFLLLMLAPFAPHIAEELWQTIGETGSIHQATWPNYDPRLATSAEATVILQVNGKLRDKITVEKDMTKDALEALARGNKKIVSYLDGKSPKKVIVVPNKLVNLVL